MGTGKPKFKNSAPSMCCQPWLLKHWQQMKESETIQGNGRKNVVRGYLVVQGFY